MNRLTRDLFVFFTTFILMAGVGYALEEKEKEGLVVYYPFDEGSGKIVKDMSGNKNDGTIIGNAEYVKSGDGYCLKFDGRSGYVECPGNPTLETETSGSIEFWFNAEAPQGGLFARNVSTSWRDERLIITFRRNGTFIWVMADGTSNEDWQASEISIPWKQEWMHLVFTFDDNVVLIYKNGKVVQTGTQLYTPALKGVPLIIGRASGIDDEYFKGMIDEVRIYNHALSGQEIMERYKTTKSNYGNE